MGKRKRHEEEEYIARKIKKLERKMTRVRRKQRHHSPSSSSVSNDDRYPDTGRYRNLDPYECDNHSEESLQEAPQSEGAPSDVNSSANTAFIRPSVPVTEGTFVPMIASTSAGSAHGLASVIVPVSTSVHNLVDMPPASSSAAGSAPMENTHELEPDILCLLGEEPIREEKFGVNVHKDIASRWTDVLVNGLKDETKNDILKSCDIPDNLKLVQAPTLNPEIKAAVNESALKRDGILAEKQKLLSSVLTCVANTITSVLTTDTNDTAIKSQTLKSLSDAGRLLCHVHYNETQTRRNFLLTCLSKEIKDNVKDLKRDHLLFGNDLQENLKSMKAIVRTGAELKSSAAKPKLPPKNKQPDASASRALNWRGPPPPQPQTRRMPARQSSTAGGRKQVPARRMTDRRAPQQRNRTSRR